MVCKIYPLSQLSPFPLFGRLFIFCCLFFSVLCIGLYNVVGQTPHLRHFTVDEGLPSSFLYCAFQDSKGYIWVCSDAGVARYDGYSFEAFGTQAGLLSNDVWDFSEDSQGRIWFHAHLSHFVFYDYTDHKLHCIKNKYAGVSNLSNFHEWQGDVWASTTAHQLINTRTGEMQQMTGFAWGVSGHTSSAILSLQNGVVSDLMRHKVLHILQSPIDQLTSSLATFNECWNDEQRFVYMANDTIYYDTPTTCKGIHINEVSHFEGNHLQRIGIAAKDKLFVLTQKEVFVVNNNLGRLPEYDFIQLYKPNSILEDREGNLWICTKNQGLYMLTREALHSRVFNTVPTSKPLANNLPMNDLQIRAVAADSAGRVWIGTVDGRIYYLEKEVLHPLPSDVPFWGHIRNICITPQNMLVASTNNHLLLVPIQTVSAIKGVVELDSKAYYLPNIGERLVWKKPPKDQIGIAPFGTKQTVLLSNGTLGMSTSQLAFNLTESPTAFEIKSLGDVRSYALAQSSNGYVFAGTPTGIKVFAKDTLNPLSEAGNRFELLSKSVMDMRTDSQQNIWVATDGAGIYCLSPMQQQQLVEQDTCRLQMDMVVPMGLEHARIKSLFVDAQDRVWATSNEGVYCIVSQNGRHHILRRFSFAQGLPTNETFSVYATPTTAYIGTNKGLAQIDLSNWNLDKCWDSDSSARPVLYFTHFAGNKQALPLSNGQDGNALPYYQNNIDIQYVCLSYQSNKQIVYTYRMVKNGDKSTPWQHSGELKREFPLLPPAKYSFQVKATDANGIETPMSYLSFEIGFPWWRQTWFYGLLAGLFVAVLWLAYYLRIRYVRSKEREKNEFAAMRLQVLQSQMNPHFMNNALNAIQLFIAHSDVFSANEYLAKFAVLNRLYLEASHRRFISLAEELELLNTYLELEHLRFSNKFDYMVSVSEQTVKEIDSFPAMLLQPLAENAINNGLLYLKRKGHLLVEVQKVNNLIYCIIDDNGIGRAASAEIKSRLKKTHLSRGMQIINELQRTVNALGKMHLAIEVIDKENENGEAQGTRVTIILTQIP